MFGIIFIKYLILYNSYGTIKHVAAVNETKPTFRLHFLLVRK